MRWIASSTEPAAGRKAVAGLVLALAAGAGACFQEPVTESLQIRLTTDGSLEVRSLTRIPAVAANPADTPAGALGHRLRDLQSRVERGDDDWGRAVSREVPAAHLRTLEYRGGWLMEADRVAVYPSADLLPEFFAGAPVSVFVDRDAETGRLEIFPTGSPRATPAEARRVRRRMGDFATALAAHVGATAALYDYLDRHPRRARPALVAFWDLDLEPADLTEEEAGLVEAMKDGLEELLAPLTLESGQAWSLDEISRRLYDPFPWDLTVESPAPALEVEGFRQVDARTLKADRRSLWSAFTALEESWLSPDPVLYMVREEDLAGNDPEAFVAAFTGRSRQVRVVPSPRQARTALEAALQGPARFTATWVEPAGS